MQAVLRQRGLQLKGILVTHHHSDHVGGVQALHSATGAPVWGPARELIPQPATAVQEGELVHALGGPWQVIDVPGHTSGHIAFYSPDAMGQGVLFCGDTLFSGGCGRLFEGTPAQMQHSLDKLAQLPDDTLVCCAHEYTLSNLLFARHVEPNNAQLALYQTRCQSLRSTGEPTLPSQIGLERAINPFLRTRKPDVAQAALHYDAQTQPQDPASVLATLRQWKNVFA